MYAICVITYIAKNIKKLPTEISPISASMVIVAENKTVIMSKANDFAILLILTFLSSLASISSSFFISFSDLTKTSQTPPMMIQIPITIIMNGNLSLGIST